MNDTNTNENNTNENSGGSVVDKVKNALQGLGGVVDKHEEDKQKEGYSPETSNPVEAPEFNFQQFLAGATPEMIQQFKQIMNATPDRISTKPEYNDAHLLREPVSKRIVVAFSDQYPSTKFDEVMQKQVDCPMINVRLLDLDSGETEDIKEEYKKFMYDYDKVNVVLLKKYIDHKDAKDGITESMETGEMVEMIKKWVVETYKVRFEDGRELDPVPARVVNAGATASKHDVSGDSAGNMGKVDNTEFNIA